MQHHGCLALLGLLMTVSGCGQNSNASNPTPQPVADSVWDAYLIDVAKAERIEDPVQRCLAYPDLPGNAWPKGSAKARCSLLRAGKPTLDEIKAILAKPDGAEALDAVYAALLVANYDDPAQRDQIFTAFWRFDESETAMQLAETWHASRPSSAFARLALGNTKLEAAWNARGAAWAKDVTAAQFQTVGRLLEQAVPMLQSAFASEPRLSPACLSLMSAGLLAGDSALREKATQDCLRIDPLSWSVRRQWQNGLEPRWGGSESALAASVEEIRKYVPQNPALGGLLASAVGTQAYWPVETGGSLQQASPGLEAASRLAPDPSYIGHAGRAALQRGDRRRALGYLSQALRLAPESKVFLASRASTRQQLGDYDGAIADAKRAIALDPNNGRAHNVLGKALSEQGHYDEALKAFDAAMQSPDDRLWAFHRRCEIYIVHGTDRDKSLACTEGLVGEYPENAEALFQRAWILYETGNPEADDVAAHFKRVADTKDTRQRTMISELKRLTGKP